MSVPMDVALPNLGAASFCLAKQLFPWLAKPRGIKDSVGKEGFGFPSVPILSVYDVGA